MAKTIRYQKKQTMEPRDGVNYATTYVKQTLDQRRDLVKHIKMVVTEISYVCDANPDWNIFVNQPLRGFRTTQGVNRSTRDILSDMCNEARGKTKKGLPKDFAMAPIERWNKLFEGTDYAVDLVQTFSTATTTFADLMEFEDDTI
jgi:hypothetical protein